MCAGQGMGFRVHVGRLFARTREGVGGSRTAPMGEGIGMGPRMREDTGGGEFFGNEILRLRYASLRMTYGGKGEGIRKLGCRLIS